MSYYRDQEMIREATPRQMFVLVRDLKARIWKADRDEVPTDVIQQAMTDLLQLAGHLSDELASRGR